MAQKYLGAAHASIELLFFNLQICRGVWKGMKGKDPRGRPLPHDVDMLRAVVVFAAAAMDATLKELIRNALTELTTVDEGAGRKFREFVEQYIGSSGAILDRKAISDVLTAQDHPREHLLEKYIEALTGDSLQSAKQVGKVCSALGVTDKSLRMRLKDGGILDQMFLARHKIVHEFDLPKPPPQTRTLPKIKLWVKEALYVAQEVINQVSDTLKKADKAS